MRKDLFVKFACFFGVGSNEPIEIVEKEYVPDESEIMNVLKEIFSVDPVSGAPLGDIAYFLSPNGNPTIKTWLTNNLLKPRFGAQMRDDKITDDMLVEFSRNADETIDDYAARLAGYRDSAIEEYNRSIESNK